MHIALMAGVAALWANAVSALDTAGFVAFRQAVAEAASTDADIAAFYRETGYQPVWTAGDEAARDRRAALIQALEGAEHHGLAPARYRVDALMQQMRDARSVRDLGLVEVALSTAFLTYARDVQTGMLVPSRVDSGIVREVPYRDRREHLQRLAASAAPQAYLRALPPDTREYRALQKEKLRLERLLGQGGWGPAVPGVPGEGAKPGSDGPQVVALRNRLIAMGYLPRTLSASYDAAMQAAIRDFQDAHGLTPDGVAGKGTMSEINRPIEARLKSVIVAMERERWTNMERGSRHILVNQTDFTARIVDDGRVTFETRSVIGKNTSDRRSPEFSDRMEHMIINPSWYVPRSIITKEYLPKLRANPNALAHMEITDRRGRRVNRASANFAQYSAGSFPFAMRQPPGSRNALGKVKFMFPNKYNIYLHDTPQKHLFDREVRAFSHGCIRLSDPFDFAYALLARQSDDPKGDFQRILRTGRETKVTLKEPVPIHLIYRTAVSGERGRMEYRRDVYGRDARIWKALNDAGVALRSVQG
nr:L,D-transpeptidase family protein [Pukyongiella litopenaei]